MIRLFKNTYLLHTIRRDIYRRLKIQIKVQETIHSWLPSILKSAFSPVSHLGLSCSVAVIYAIHGTGLMTVIHWWSCIHHFCPGCTSQMDPDHPSPVRDASVHTAARGTNKSLAFWKGQCQLHRAPHKNSSWVPPPFLNKDSHVYRRSLPC